MPRLVLLDQDGVLTDWIGGVARLFGVDPTTVEVNREPGEWSITAALGKTLGAPYFTEDDIWERIHAKGESFWAELEPTPYCTRLMRLVTSKVGSQGWRILTSPSRCPSSYSGKARWVLNHFGSAKFILPFAEKELLAAPDRTLIDDSEKNVNKFIAAGGQGIIFPSRANRLYKSAHDPLPSVEYFLT